MESSGSTWRALLHRAAEGTPHPESSFIIDEIPRRMVHGGSGAAASMASAEQGRLEEWLVRRSNWLAIGMIAGAFLLRLTYAASCYLNPDEALHFAVARPNSWHGAFEASHAMPHPPLFILVLHGFLFLGRSEVILRLPSVIGGTVALGFTFAWIRRSLGVIAGLAGLLFMALSPAAVSASTEVRQYGMLLCFVCGALYATERALTERSTGWAIVQGIFLMCALLTHYTALVVICSLALYVLVRGIAGHIPRRVALGFAAMQLALAAVVGWLYIDHVGQSKVFKDESMSYLRQFFYVRGSETLLGFTSRALYGTFSYLVSPEGHKLALLSILVFLAGLAAVVTHRAKTNRLTLLLIAAPFLVGFTAALLQVFPFTGSRHQTYLLPFLAAAFSAALAWAPRKLAAPLLLVAVAVAPIWGMRNPPDNNPEVVPIGKMTEAIVTLQESVPPGAPIITDGQTHPILRYYLGRDDSSLDTEHPIPRGSDMLAGHHILTPMGFVRSFNAKDALVQANEAAISAGVPQGTPLWIVSMAWPVSKPLASQLPAEGLHYARVFATISLMETTRE